MSGSRGRLLAAVLCALGASACVTSPAPYGYLAKAELAISDPYGSWIRVTGRDTASSTTGEFLGASADTVFVLRQDSVVVRVSKAAIVNARVGYFDPASGDLELWAILGLISTVSNGFFLVFTAPIWIIGSTISINRHVKSSLRDLGADRDWAPLLPYARFPQGIPAGLPDRLPTKPTAR